nr:uncharacterized protein LOC123764553 [Procambarus clarkii]
MGKEETIAHRVPQARCGQPGWHKRRKKSGLALTPTPVPDHDSRSEAAPRSAPRLIDTWASTLTTSTFCLLCTRDFSSNWTPYPLLVPQLMFFDPLGPSTSQAGTAGAPCPTQQTLSSEKPDHAATATRKRARATSREDNSAVV